MSAPARGCARHRAPWFLSGGRPRLRRGGQPATVPRPPHVVGPSGRPYVSRPRRIVRRPVRQGGHGSRRPALPRAARRARRLPEPPPNAGNRRSRGYKSSVLRAPSTNAPAFARSRAHHPAGRSAARPPAFARTAGTWGSRPAAGKCPLGGLTPPALSTQVVPSLQVLAGTGASPVSAETSHRALPFSYTGRRFDSETGLEYFRNRMHSAKLGVFLSRDPYGAIFGWNYYGIIEFKKDTIPLINFGVGLKNATYHRSYARQYGNNKYNNRKVPGLYAGIEHHAAVKPGMYYAEGMNLYIGIGIDQFLDPSGMQRYPPGHPGGPLTAAGGGIHPDNMNENLGEFFPDPYRSCLSEGSMRHCVNSCILQHHTGIDWLTQLIAQAHGGDLPGSSSRDDGDVMANSGGINEANNNHSRVSCLKLCASWFDWAHNKLCCKGKPHLKKTDRRCIDCWVIANE